MDAKEIYASLEKLFPGKVSDLKAEVLEPYLTVDKDAIVEICRFLHSAPGFKFEVLSDLTALDWPKEEKIQVVYHLFSYSLRHTFVLKVNAKRDDPVVATVSSVWSAGDWQEREVFDLLGVSFTGHPDLRRILMPEDWPGHPLRKDFVEPQEYHGIPTSRESLLKV